MLASDPPYRRPAFWRRFIAIALFVIFVLLFWREFQVTLKFVWALIAGGDIKAIAPDPRRGAVVPILICFNGIFFFLVLALVAQFVLPVRTTDERMTAVDRLFTYFWGGHGPAMFVKEGKQIARAEELKRNLPGVAVVDFKSAVVLERQPHARSLLGILLRLFMRPFRKSQKLDETESVNEDGRKVPTIAVVSSGVTFTEIGQRVKGVVDLRPQFRIQLGVRASTSDGIGVENKVLVAFTLGQDPDVIMVGYALDEQLPPRLRYQNIQQYLRVIQLEETTPADADPNLGRRFRVTKIKEFSEEFDAADQRQVKNFMRDFIETGQPSAAPGLPPKLSLAPRPFVFNAERVRAAIYSRTRDVKAGTLIDWSELPTQIAVEIYRDLISRWAYDDLYLPSQPVRFPILGTVKPEFSRTVRNNGLLSFQYICLPRSRFLFVGQEYRQDELFFSPVQELHAPRPLRDRGIKVLFAGFTELQPVEPAVFQQRVDSWRAFWQKEADETIGNAEREFMRMRAETLARARREVAHMTGTVLDGYSDTEKGWALRVLQLLETKSSDPLIRELLSEDTWETVRQIKQTLY